ncbi:reverse transcriptase domain-containing protein [Flavobacterium microcysteis]|uniref:RNA-dependent DNA polymerase n=1 Tax=Flavobacterium microcysteis TaxID=2596891 RepID=A0A501QF69_9FLAO|nr:reverse transcriptase domain-containing protein [Flavobacterium microcysteis]TPD71118.1 RNA-dependent DNA polymerase [Flavobacterium microcysteis]
MENSKDWFRLKKYPHIGLPLKLKHKAWVENYVTNPDLVKKHSFYPFIHRKLSVRKFRQKKLEDGTKTKERFESYKEREVFYANHLDSNIYSYYSSLLGELYEKKLDYFGIADCVTAYRSIRLNEKSESRNKCNIDFANDVFSYIKSNKRRNLVAITFDITSFFDNLNHLKLKKAWCSILQTQKLPDDHYAVFKNLTKFSYVEIDDLYNEFKDEIIVNTKTGISKIKVSQLGLLKEKNAVAFCELKDFNSRIRKKKLVKNNKFSDKENFRKGTQRTKGIPQGSPISATLANIYLLQFDAKINSKIIDLGGIYRRYSDDMIVIIDENHKDEIYQYFLDEILKENLLIQPSKTQIFYFKEFNGVYGCKELNQITDVLTSNTKFEYLGFSFNGSDVYLKSSGLSKFYRKMKRSIRRGGFYAKYGSNNVPHLFKNRLYKKFTHLGSQRKKIFKPDPHNPNKFLKTGEYDWGNFLSYANLAERIFKSKKIKNQVKGHWKKFDMLLKSKEKEITKFHHNSK